VEDETVTPSSLCCKIFTVALAILSCAGLAQAENVGNPQTLQTLPKNAVDIALSQQIRGAYLTAQQTFSNAIASLTNFCPNLALVDQNSVRDRVLTALGWQSRLPGKRQEIEEQLDRQEKYIRQLYTNLCNPPLGQYHPDLCPSS
jgi:hypothetical protein